MSQVVVVVVMVVDRGGTMPLIACANVKGGQGKSTWAVILASMLEAGLLDVDFAQGDSCDWAARADFSPAEKVWPESVVERMGQASEDARWWVADCPPGEGVAFRAALGAATAILVPVGCGTNDIRGWGRMSTVLAEVRKELSPLVRVGIVLNGVRAGCRTHEEAVEFFQTTVHDPKALTWFLGTVGLRQAIPDAIRDGRSPAMVGGIAGDEIQLISHKFVRSCVREQE
jgi:cellulose biosynthesis protein BcsQ